MKPDKFWWLEQVVEATSISPCIHDWASFRSIATGRHWYACETCGAQLSETEYYKLREKENGN